MSNSEPKTPEEFDALPVGGGFGRRIENGISIPIPPDVVAFHAEGDTILSRLDAEGAGWMLGRYANGRWFKRRM